jgi:methylene-tetrahydrofolate reductase-like protein
MSLLDTVERVVKEAVWDCRMCGQCVLHDTGLTCPMTCPKSLRNGPCGGVRPNGNCEVVPEMRCVWLKAYRRADHIPVFGEHINRLRPPVDNRLWDTSSWRNLATGRDREVPAGWPVD